MRSQLHERLEGARRRHPAWGISPCGTDFGYFEIRGPSGDYLRIVSSGSADRSRENEGWEHVSVSLPNRVPNWEEMAFVKDLFWSGSETVIQYHPKKSHYVNQMPFCLHLWKPPVEVVLPPMQMV